MAYNIAPPAEVTQSPLSELSEEDRAQLKKIDKIDHAIDNFSDEKIGGNKIFTEVVVAEGYQLHDGRFLNPPAVEKIRHNRRGALLLSTGDVVIESAANLSYNGTTLLGKKLQFETLVGDGSGLQNLDGCNLQGILNLDTIDLPSDSGLSVDNNKLSVDFEAAEPMSKKGQTIADGDKLLLYDVSHDGLRHATFGELYHDYIRTKQHHPGGDRQALQFKRGNSFGGSRHLRFDEHKNILDLDGTLKAERAHVEQELVVRNNLRTEGAVHHKVIHTSESKYEVQEDDYTILADVVNNEVHVILPPAAQHHGRVVNIKLVNSQKYNIKSNKVIIKSAGGTIDFFDDTTLKMNTSFRSVQSDGENWWIIGAKGT